jgi:transposase, IS30 family
MPSVGPPRLPREQQRQFWRLVRQGAMREAAGVAVGASATTGRQWFADAGGMLPRCSAEPSGRYLSVQEREEIAVLHRRVSLREIARRLGRQPSTVSREIRRNKAPSHPYRATRAQSLADERARRPRQGKLARHEPLRRFVQDRLAGASRLSPEQIVACLHREFPDDERMRISHEAIYQALYIQGRGELRRELHRCLRSGRALRKPQGQPNKRRTRIKDMVMISERPAEVADRAVPGHWEGDLILGKNGRSAIGTLVERSTRFVMLLHLPADRSAPTVRDAITAAMTTLPAALRRTLTWDQGIELAEHAQLAVAADLDVYFCDPHSPWQRGTNENTNGLLRQYFPKGTDLGVHGPDELAYAADGLNQRPRKTLGWKTPAEALTELLSRPTTAGVATTT